MKSVVISTVVVALAGGTWTWVAPDRGIGPLKREAVSDVGERVGLKRMLSAREDLRLANLVVGGQREGLRSFRARLIENGQARPVFGQARRVCESAPDLAECWEIALLHVDGKLRELPFGEDAQTAAQDQPVDLEADTDDDDIETSDIPVTAPEPTPEEPTAAPTQATHLVARPIVNARSGPGLSSPVLFKLSQGARLELITKQSGWGKFVVLDGESQGTEAWAALSILEALP